MTKSRTLGCSGSYDQIVTAPSQGSLALLQGACPDIIVPAAFAFWPVRVGLDPLRNGLAGVPRHGAERQIPLHSNDCNNGQLDKM